MNAKSPSTPSSSVDPDDAPELTDDDFERGVWHVGERVVTPEEGKAAMGAMAQAARRGRPKAEVTKEPVKLRLDADVLTALRASGEGWQTRINETLRASLRLAGRL
jgi:uncharacterized protein (DUF4415 family)